jgi:hypothetical protein
MQFTIGFRSFLGRERVRPSPLVRRVASYIARFGTRSAFTLAAACMQIAMRPSCTEGFRVCCYSAAS